MIVFDLQCCEGRDTFEAWFRSGADFEEQRAQGLVQCPYCGSTAVEKAPMAPSVPRKSSASPLEKLAAAQAELLKNSRWVGEDFAETARAIHSGDLPAQQVHGQATLEQARSLVGVGVPVTPLPLPIARPTELN